MDLEGRLVLAYSQMCAESGVKDDTKERARMLSLKPHLLRALFHALREHSQPGVELLLQRLS
jgi:hypothetical protein